MVTKKEINWLIRDKYQGQINTPQYFSDLERLKLGEPLDYVIGWKDFLGCRVDLSYHPLIPREETEFWVGEVIKGLNVGGLTSKSPEVLDLFAGSGCIGLAILRNLKSCKVTFAEKDEKICEQIRKNLKLNKLKGKVVKTDVFSSVKGKFDYIFANPPYIPTSKSLVQKSVKNWEPKLALYSGNDGLILIKRFLKEAKDHLKPQGKIYLEFGFGQKTAIEKLLKQFGYTHYQFHKDQFKRWRFVGITW